MRSPTVLTPGAAGQTLESPKYCVYSRYSVNPGPGLCLAGLPKPRDRAQNQCSELLSTSQRPREESPGGHFLDGKTEPEVASVKRDCDEKKSQSGGRQAWLDLRTGVCLSVWAAVLPAGFPSRQSQPAPGRNRVSVSPFLSARASGGAQ